MKDISKINWTAIGSIASVAALLFAVSIAWIQSKSTKKTITAQILYVQSLDVLRKDDTLKVNFSYNGKTVVAPWRMGLRLQNTGETTVVGSGRRSELIADQLRLWVTKQYQILQISVENCDFQASASVLNLESFSLKFQQWRPGESCNLAIYTTSTVRSSASPSLDIRERDLIDGDIFVVQAQDHSETSRYKRWMDSVPRPMAFAWKLISVVGLAILLAIGILFPIGAWIEYSRIRFWRKTNQKNFEVFIRGLPKTTLSETTKERVIKQPYFLQEELWSNFSGQIFPSKTGPFFDTGREGLSMTGFFFLIALVASGGLLSLF